MALDDKNPANTKAPFWWVSGAMPDTHNAAVTLLAPGKGITNKPA